MMVYQLIFWCGMFLIAYTYLGFPLVLKAVAALRRTGKEASAQTRTGESSTTHPRISVLISAYNEEELIEEKVRTVLDSDYPAERMEILVGSDASEDSTNDILTRMSAAEERIRFFPFEKRSGKPGVINRLVEKSAGEILVLTDANVMLDKNTLRLLMEAFQDPDTGLVDTRMVNTQLKRDGISHQERFYISREVGIKHMESRLWGSMMGPFGGCFAVRREYFRPVPGHFLVDDFFINMSVLEQGKRCHSCIEAMVYEDVSNDLKEEFRRKKRISAGNFQNLGRFGHMLFTARFPVSFCFLSHKVIRWLVPFIVILTLASSFLLVNYSSFYRLMALLQIIVLLLPVIDHLMRKIKIQILPLRFISHFVIMNLALFAGFFRYIGGIETNVWQPTRRNQGKTG